MSARIVWPDYAGLRGWSKARTTKTWVGVYNGAEAGLDTAEGEQPWSTVCEEHSGVCSHRTLTDAKGWASHPEVWCDECREATTPWTEGESMIQERFDDERP